MYHRTTVVETFNVGTDFQGMQQQYHKEYYKISPGSSAGSLESGYQSQTLEFYPTSGGSAEYAGEYQVVPVDEYYTQQQQGVSVEMWKCSFKC